MKIILILSIFFSYVLSAEIEGFRDLKWYDSPDKLQEYIRVEKDDKAKFLSVEKQKEKLNIGSIRVDKIVYTFFDNKLFKVEIQSTGIENYNDIVGAFEEKYGKFKHHDGVVKISKLEKGNVKIEAAYIGSISNGSTIIITNTVIEKEFNTYKSKQASKEL